MELREVIGRMVSSLPFIFFVLAAIISSFTKARRGRPAKDLQKRAAKVDNDYYNGPAEDKAIAKPQGVYANRSTAPRPSQVSVSGGAAKNKTAQTMSPSKTTGQGAFVRTPSQKIATASATSGSQGFAPKKKRKGEKTSVVESMTNSRGYVDANELDWSFEADNKPRRIPQGFDR